MYVCICVYNGIQCTLNNHVITSTFYIEMLILKLDIYIAAYSALGFLARCEGRGKNKQMNKDSSAGALSMSLCLFPEIISPGM